MPANGLPISGGAPLDRERTRAASRLQKSDDLGDAKRRPLYAGVGRYGDCVKHLYKGLACMLACYDGKYSTLCSILLLFDSSSEA
jgi:hypothetical protein